VRETMDLLAELREGFAGAARGLRAA
jgi:hypothetical protein